MFLWAVEASSCTRAKRETIWKLLEDVAHWPLWDNTLEAAHIEGPFAVGSIGWVKRKSASPLPMKITFTEKNQRFGMVAKKFCTTIAYTYQINTHTDGSVWITARVIVGGLLAPFFRMTYAKKLKNTLPITLDTLAQKADAFK